MAITIGELAAGITLDTSRFEKGITATKREIREAGQVVKAAQTPLENYAEELAKLDNLLKKGAINQNTYNRAVENAGEAFANSLPEAEAVPSLFDKITGAAGGIAPQIMLAEMAMKALSTAAHLTMEVVTAAISEAVEQAKEIDRIGDVANATGFGADFIAGIEHASQQSGGGVEAVEKSLKKFTLELGKGSKGFEAIGLEVQELQRMKPEDAFLKTLDALQAIDNQSERNAAAFKIFGKSAFEMQGLINEGAEGVRVLTEEAEALGLVLTPEQVADVQAMQDEIDKLNDLWSGLGRQLAAEFAPQITELVRLIVDFGKEAMEGKGEIAEFAAASREGLATMVDLLSAATEQAKLLAQATGLVTFAHALEDLERITGKGGLPLIIKAITGLDIQPTAAGNRIRGAGAGKRDTATGGTGPQQSLDDLADDVADDGAADLSKFVERLADDLATPGEKLQKRLDELAAALDAGAFKDHLELYNRAIEQAEKEFERDSGITEAAEKQRREEEKIANDKRLQEEQAAQKIAREAEQVHRQNMTPFEKLQEEGERLAELFDAGAISQEDYTRAAAKAADDFRKATAVDEVKPTDVSKRIFGPTDSVARGSAEANRMEFQQRNPQLKKQIDTAVQQLNELRKIAAALSGGAPTVSLPP